MPAKKITTHHTFQTENNREREREEKISTENNSNEIKNSCALTAKKCTPLTWKSMKS